MECTVCGAARITDVAEHTRTCGFDGMRAAEPAHETQKLFESPTTMRGQTALDTDGE